jgi:acyl-coenzyme A synthetase/AMP-(fatty) acid ligase
MRYRSGTTGRSKGAVHTHRQLFKSADSYARDCVEPTSEDLFGVLTRPARACLGQSIDSIRL